MFTGLIEEVGVVRALSSGEIAVKCQKLLEGTKIGDSIAVNGVCLSVTAMSAHHLNFRVSPETSKLTNLAPGRLAVGTPVNLERALRYADRLGGHLVSGHVDGLGRLIEVVRLGDFVEMEFWFPAELRPFLARKGSVAVDGISLTVASVRSQSFVVAVIPQTLSDTHLSGVRVGSEVHLEVDMLARYVHHMLTVGVTPKEVL